MRRKQTKKRAVVFQVLVVLTFVIVPACGKKGPPRPPRAVTPPAVSDLSAKVEGERIQLSWSIPRRDDEVVEGIEGFQIFRYRTQDREKLCPDCPMDFRTFKKVDAPTAGTEDRGRVTAYDVLERGYGYAYKVLVLHESGGVSKDSNIAKVMPR